MTPSIPENLEKVRFRIAQFEQKYERESGSVTLLAVSKTHGPEEVRSACHAGQTDFGENYLQEALDKQHALADLDINWHFIGPIQSNKTRAIAENFSWVHSLDRLKIAERLSAQRPALLPPLQVCIQINIDDEQSKSGIAVDELTEFASTIEALPRLNLRGLMTIPAADGNSATAFASMQTLFNQLQNSGRHPQLDTLSMGMSADLELAIQHGATMVRIGTDIFGARS